ncbi:MAG: Holliday junction branch migration protein RuvA, partial [Henriciella sp.]
LVNLGYGQSDAARAVAAAAREAPDADTSALIRAGLKELSPS